MVLRSIQLKPLYFGLCWEETRGQVTSLHEENQPTVKVKWSPSFFLFCSVFLNMPLTHLNGAWWLWLIIIMGFPVDRFTASCLSNIINLHTTFLVLIIHHVSDFAVLDHRLISPVLPVCPYEFTCLGFLVLCCTLFLCQSFWLDLWSFGPERRTGWRAPT